MAAGGVFFRRTDIADAPAIAGLVTPLTNELFGDIDIVNVMCVDSRTRCACCGPVARPCWL